MTTIGDRIKKARTEGPAGKVSRKDLAAAAGIAYTTLADIENGYSTSTTALHKIARRLGTRVEWLETGKGPKEADDQDIADAATETMLLTYGAIGVPHVAGFDGESGPAQMAFPKSALIGLTEYLEKGSLGWIVNPTDSMGDMIPKGALVLLDQSDRGVGKNGIYATRLYDQRSIMRIQVRDSGAIRVMGSNRFDDSIDLHGEAINSLHIGGRVVGYIDRAKLID